MRGYDNWKTVDREHEAWVEDAEKFRDQLKREYERFSTEDLLEVLPRYSRSNYENDANRDAIEDVLDGRGVKWDAGLVMAQRLYEKMHGALASGWAN